MNSCRLCFVTVWNTRDCALAPDLLINQHNKSNCAFSSVSASVPSTNSKPNSLQNSFTYGSERRASTTVIFCTREGSCEMSSDRLLRIPCASFCVFSRSALHFSSTILLYWIPIQFTPHTQIVEKLLLLQVLRICLAFTPLKCIRLHCSR